MTEIRFFQQIASCNRRLATTNCTLFDRAFDFPEENIAAQSTV